MPSTPTVGIIPTNTINQIIAQYPKTLPVFNFFGFDTCCGGALPLQEAVARHGLSLEVVIRALQEATT